MGRHKKVYESLERPTHIILDDIEDGEVTKKCKLHKFTDAGWKPIEEAPKDGSPVEVWGPSASLQESPRAWYACYVSGTLALKEGWYVYCSTGDGVEPTHFREIHEEPDTD